MTYKHVYGRGFKPYDEWYTPIEYIEATKQVMGDIDLDPATSEIAQNELRIKNYYTKETNGLTKPWFGRVFLHPPRNRLLLNRFIDKAVKEYNNGNIKAMIVLVSNHTETEWFQKLSNNCTLCCFTIGRIKFWSDKRKQERPFTGSTFFYFGPDNHKFFKVFSSFCRFPNLL